MWAVCRVRIHSWVRGTTATSGMLGWRSLQSAPPRTPVLAHECPGFRQLRRNYTKGKGSAIVGRRGRMPQGRGDGGGDLFPGPEFENCDRWYYSKRQRVTLSGREKPTERRLMRPRSSKLDLIQYPRRIRGCKRARPPPGEMDSIIGTAAIKNQQRIGTPT